MSANSFIEPRAAIYLQMPHQSTDLVHGVAYSHFALARTPEQAES